MAMRRSTRPASFRLAFVVLAWALAIGPARGQGRLPIAPDSAPSRPAAVPDQRKTSNAECDLLADLPPWREAGELVSLYESEMMPGNEDGGPNDAEPFPGRFLQAFTDPLGPPVVADGPEERDLPESPRREEGVDLYRPSRAPRKLNGTSEWGWATLTSEATVQDAPPTPSLENPVWKSSWQTQQALRLTMPGPFFVFGQVGANADEFAPQTSQVAGQTGLACKVPVGPAAEFQVRSGPRITYTDALRQDRTRGQSDWLLEVQARWPLLFGVGLEYQGSAAPALGPLQHDWINQDVHLAVPLGSTGKMQVGAKHRWESSTTPQPWSDGMQLYLGLQLTR